MQSNTHLSHLSQQTQNRSSSSLITTAQLEHCPLSSTSNLTNKVSNKDSSPRVSAGLGARLVALLCFLAFFDFSFVFLSFSFFSFQLLSLLFFLPLSCLSFSFHLYFFLHFLSISSSLFFLFQFLQNRGISDFFSFVIDCFFSSTCCSWQMLR